MRRTSLSKKASLMAWLSAVISLIGSVSPANAREGALSASTLERARERGSVRIIVQLDLPSRPASSMGEPSFDSSAISSHARAIAAAQATVLQSLSKANVTALRQFETIPFMAMKVDDRGLVELERSAQVVAVHEDRALPAALAASGPIVEADEAAAAGFDGSGQVVVVLDSGVDQNHTFFSGRVVDEACFSAKGDCPNRRTSQLGAGAARPCNYAQEGCKHGTHVAGIAVGRGGQLSGVAPGARLLPIQVFSRFNGTDCGRSGEDPCALSFDSDRVAALERVFQLRNTYSIASVNISVGGGKFGSQAACDADSAAEKAAIDQLRAAGIATVISAGNDGFVDGIGSPACISSAISVGSTTKQDGLSSFSNSAPFLSLLAPGSSIVSSLPGGGFGSRSGTSMAAPHLAGAWAVLRQKAPGASVDAVLNALRATGIPITNPMNDVATSRIRIRHALDALSDGGTGPDSAIGALENPNGAVSGISIFSGWVCNARQVTIQVDGGAHVPAAYGTPRADTGKVCGGPNNGFGLLFSMNLLGPGDHTAVAYADGVRFGSVSFSVTTLGVPFLRNAPDTVYTLSGFGGHDVLIQWNEALQNFVIVGRE